jgi:gluconokinase
MIILVMGVTGAGKTAVGRKLARDLDWRFVDADDYHSAANVAKMHAGIPLTDEDRAPWLQSLQDAITGWLASGEDVVLACSALKQSYRAVLLIHQLVKLVYLRATPELITARLAARTDHYMNPHLTASQFETLEEPQDAVVVDAAQDTSQIACNIRIALGL